MAHQKEVEEKHKLSEDLHYGKVGKEALPIHLDNNILKKISILRGVKKDHNMGHYPDELIHCICEAMHNICWNPNVIAKEFMQHKMKNELKPIKHSIRRLAKPHYSLKKMHKSVQMRVVAK